MSVHPFPSSAQDAPQLLLQRLAALRQTEPHIRARDAAARLGVSECELVAARCGSGAVRLRGEWPEMLQALPALGEVMVLTRNDHCVHEKYGRFDKVSVFGSQGLVVNHDIDLRIFFAHWAHGYALTEETRSGVRDSLQFFDADGTAVHKVYVTENSDRSAYAALVERFRGLDQVPGEEVLPSTPPAPDRPDSEIDAVALRSRWRALKDTHDFFLMLKEVGAGRLQALRLAGPELACPVGNDSFQRAVRVAAERKVPIMVFVGNPGIIQIHSGPVSNLKEIDDWFNVLDPGFNLHLVQSAIASSWVVRKPTTDGTVTSIEIFDREARQIAWLFGERKPGIPELASWREVAETIANAAR